MAKILTEDIDKEISKEQSKFIYEELIPGVVKRVLASTSKNQRFANVLKELLETVCDHFSRMLDCSPEHPHLADMADAMRPVFDNTQKFHTTQFQNLAAGIIKEQISLDNFPPEEQQWRK